MSREVEFPHGATVRELAAALAAVPQEDQEKEVSVMFTPMGATPLLDGCDQPGVIWALDPFPTTVDDPQPPVATWTIRAKDGIATAAEVETLRAFQEFHDQTAPAGTIDQLFEIASGLIADDMKDFARDQMELWGWVRVVDGEYVPTEEGLKQLRSEGD